MSDYESHVGKIILFPRKEKETDKEYLQRALGDKYNETYWEYDESIPSYLGESDLYDEVFYINGKLYLSVEHKELDYGDMAEISGNDSDGYNYVTSFYNGETCLSEMIGYMLKNKTL